MNDLPLRDENPDDWRPKVFILEDNPLISMDLATTAEQEGYEVLGPLHALSPEVIHIAESGDVDVALIDLMLANGSSESIVREFQNRGIPVIICSGTMNAEVRMKFPEAQVLGKPHLDENLRRMLSHLLVFRISCN